MALRPCLDCGDLSQGTRCPPCKRAHDNQRYARRGTTAQRGLHGMHDAMAKLFKLTNAACQCDDCGAHDGVCGRYGTPDNPITAGHRQGRADGGGNVPANYRPECRSCNSRRGARGL